MSVNNTGDVAFCLHLVCLIKVYNNQFYLLLEFTVSLRYHHHPVRKDMVGGFAVGLSPVWGAKIPSVWG